MLVPSNAPLDGTVLVRVAHKAALDVMIRRLPPIAALLPMVRICVANRAALDETVLVLVWRSAALLLMVRVLVDSNALSVDIVRVDVCSNATLHDTILNVPIAALVVIVLVLV